MIFRALLFLLLIVSVGMIGCNSSKEQTWKTIYIEYNTGDDSLKMTLLKNTSGKVSYLDEKKIMHFVPESYLTEGYKGIHYYRPVDGERESKTAENALKYQVQFNNAKSNDSIAYTLKKYIYTKNNWKLKSDMGDFKVFDYLSEYDRKLKYINENVATNVIGVIAADSYSE